MNEAELWIRMLESIGQHAQACAAEIRALRAQAGDNPATREDRSTPDVDAGGDDEVA